MADQGLFHIGQVVRAVRGDLNSVGIVSARDDDGIRYWISLVQYHGDIGLFDENQLQGAFVSIEDTLSMIGNFYDGWVREHPEIVQTYITYLARSRRPQ